MSQLHRFHEVWINVGKVLRAERGTRIHQVVLTFGNDVAVQEFLESICTGHELQGGGVRHQDGLHCPVHHGVTH